MVLPFSDIHVDAPVAGQTYGNPCELTSLSCIRKNNVVKLHNGECSPAKVTPRGYNWNILGELPVGVWVVEGLSGGRGGGGGGKRAWYGTIQNIENFSENNSEIC